MQARLIQKIVVLLFFNCFFLITLKSQSLPVLRLNNNTNSHVTPPFEDLLNKDSLLNQLLQTTAIQNIKEDFISSLNGLKSNQLFDKLNNTLKKANDIRQIYQSTVVNLNYYKTNMPDSLISSNDFLNANISFNLNIMNIPFSVQTSAVMENGKLRTDFSYTNVRFNWEQYQEAVKRKISGNTLKDYFKVDQLTQQLKISKIDSATLLHDAKFALYNAVVNHPKVAELKYRIAQQIDSLMHQVDSIKDSRTQKFKDSLMYQVDSIKEGRTQKFKDSLMYQVDSIKEGRTQKLMDSLNTLKERFQKFEQQYEALWEKRKQVFSKIEELKARFNNAEQELNRLSDFNYLKQKALGYKKLNLKDKLMLNTKNLEVGQMGADEDDFTLKNQLLNGFKYEYEGLRKHWGVIVGTSRLRSLNTPVFYNPFQRTMLGRQFLYFKYGYTTPDSGQITFKLLNVRKTNDTLFRGQLTPDYNTVLSVGHEKKLLKQWSIITDIAYSNLRENWLTTVEKPKKFYDDLAMSSALLWTYKDFLKVGAGYFYVGNHFITYGNDFLLNNRNGFKFDIQSAWFRNKLTTKASVKTGFLNDPTVVGLSKSTVTQMSGEINWQLAKNSSIQFQYTPNTVTQVFRNTEGASAYDYTTNIYILSGIFNYNIHKKRQSTYIILSNLNQQVDFFDSLRFNKSMFVNIRHESAISDKSSIVLNSNLGFANDVNTIQTGLMQADVRTAIKKNLRLIMGLQAVKKTFDKSWRGGVVTNLSLDFNKIFNWRCGVIYRKKAQDSILTKDEFIGNTSITMQF